MDDSSVQLQHAIALCTRLGWNVVETASDGLDALLKLKKSINLPDLVLLDLEMPGINGVALLQELARLQLHMAVVVLSSREASLLESVGYMARQSGLNLLQVLQKPLTSAMLEQLPLHLPSASNPTAVQIECSEDEFSTALAAGQVISSYTPRTVLETGLVKRLSAQMVWLHPEHGPLHAAQYANQIADSRIYLQAYNQHLDTVLSQIQTWASKGLPLSVQLDLPAKLVASPLQARTLLAKIENSGLSESAICFEVSAQALAQDSDAMLPALNILRIQNIGLAIRDYSVHFDWVRYMGRVPFNELILDREVLDKAMYETLSLVLFEQMIALAHKLNMKVTIDGLSQLAQWQMLKQIHCDYAQGPLVGTGLSAAEIAPWLRENIDPLRQLAHQAEPHSPQI
ncbi:EAL domain-containing protein [Chitinibacter bivalviorum]|uniref:EAL domain-containing protein n=1 Tax=Chitinibacter bivalviorum TaxID=2739434 RepID=A0A7H9BJV2_9NEIS|nr:EAL domain-containing protein [Chitinibacter bivalviorum]